MTERHPVVFIHGLWLQASSWHQWVKLFESLVIDSRWQAVAESCLSWMDAHEL